MKRSQFSTYGKDLNFAFGSFIEAHKFIIKHRLLKYILLIGLFFLILFLAYIALSWKGIDYALGQVQNWAVLQNWQESYPWLYWPIVIIKYTLQTIIVLLMIFVYKYIVLFLGSPLFAYISEKTEEIAKGHTVKFSLSQLLKDIGRGIRIAVRNLVRQTLFTATFMVLSLLPVVGWIAPWIIARKDWYYYGFSMLDYSCERHRMGVRESIDFIQEHNLLATINGLVFYALMLIPILGPLLAPSYCSIAATLAFLKIQENEKIQTLSTSNATFGGQSRDHTP